MPDQKLINDLHDLSNRIETKKQELAAKITPLVQEFLNDTGLLVRSIEPHYVEVTSMEDPLRQFAATSADVYVDVDIRGISNRRVD